MHAYYACVLCVCSMHAYYACVLCMRSMHAYYACVLCMRIMHAYFVCFVCFYVFCLFLLVFSVFLSFFVCFYACVAGADTAVERDRIELGDAGPAGMHACILCMRSRHAYYACLLCMRSMHAYYACVRAFYVCFQFLLFFGSICMPRLRTADKPRTALSSSWL